MEKHQSKFLMILTALTICPVIAACGSQSELDELNSITVDPSATIAAEQLVTETTTEATYILTASSTEATETTAENDEPAVDYKGNFAGKWELSKWNDQTEEAGQFGTESYQIMYQMQLNANGSCVLYDRCSGIASEGTWDGLNETTALIQFPDYTKNSVFQIMNLDRREDRLCSQSMAIIFSAVNSFSQPAHPSVYSVAGNWVCDTITDAEGNQYTDAFRDIPVDSFRVNIYSIEDVASITYQGAQFFAHDDGTGKLSVAYENTGAPTHGWDGTSMWMNGSSLVWEVQEEDGISQLYFHKSDN